MPNLSQLSNEELLALRPQKRGLSALSNDELLALRQPDQRPNVRADIDKLDILAGEPQSNLSSLRLGAPGQPVATTAVDTPTQPITSLSDLAYGAPEGIRNTRPRLGSPAQAAQTFANITKPVVDVGREMISKIPQPRSPFAQGRITGEQSKYETLAKDERFRALVARFGLQVPTDIFEFLTQTPAAVLNPPEGQTVGGAAKETGAGVVQMFRDFFPQAAYLAQQVTRGQPPLEKYRGRTAFDQPQEGLQPGQLSEAEEAINRLYESGGASPFYAVGIGKGAVKEAVRLGKGIARAVTPKVEPTGRTVKLPSLEEPILQRKFEPPTEPRVPLDEAVAKSETTVNKPSPLTVVGDLKSEAVPTVRKNPRLAEAHAQKLANEYGIEYKRSEEINKKGDLGYFFNDPQSKNTTFVVKTLADLPSKLEAVRKKFNPPVSSKPSPLTDFSARQREAVTPEIPKPPQLPPETPPTTSAPQPRGGEFVLNNENIAKIRKSYAGFDQLAPKEKKGVLKSSEEAIKNRYDENAHAIAQEVNKKSRPLSDSEQAGMFLRVNEVEPQYLESIDTWKKLRDEGKTDAARLEYSRANKFRQEMDDISTALRYSGGTEVGRAMAIRRNLKRETINEILFEAEQLKGKRLTEPETQKLESTFDEQKRLEKQLADMTAKYEVEKLKNNEVVAARVINTELRKKRKASERQKIDEELSNIEKQLQDMGYRVNDITGASVEAAYLIGKYAKTLAKKGGLEFEGIVTRVREKFGDFTREDVLEGIVSKDPSRQIKAKSEATKRVQQLQQQAKLLLDIEKAEQGIFEPRQNRPTAPLEIKQLQDKLKALRKEAYRSQLDDGRLERSLNLINQLQDQLQNQYRSVKKQKSIPPQELAEAKEKISELRKQMRVEDALADLNEQFRTGDFKIREKPQPKHIPEELERLQVQLKRKRRQLRDIQESIGASYDPRTLKGLKTLGQEGINTARTLKATADMSATLRQGLFPSIHLLRKGKIKNLANITGNAVKSFFSEYTADRIDNMIREMDNHYIRERAGLYLAERGTPKALRREEHFMSKVVDRIPVLKQVTRASERHMTTTLNLLRVSMFDSFLEKFPNATTVELKAWADFVNAASGRGEIGGALNGLNNIFFAPRFAASRFQTPTKAFKYWKHPRVRNEIVKDLSATIGAGLMTLEIAHLLGAEVGLDPREADFGKIRIGDQRFDIWAGFQQPARLIAHAGTNLLERAGVVDPVTIQDSENYDPVEAIGRFAGFKLSPAITLPREFWTGRTAVGQETTRPETFWRALVPIVYQEFYDEGLGNPELRGQPFGTRLKSGFTKETLTGAGVGFFGVGANLYEDSRNRVRRDIIKLLKDGKKEEATERAANWNEINPDDRIVELNVVSGADTTKVRVAPDKPRRQR